MERSWVGDNGESEFDLAGDGYTLKFRCDNGKIASSVLTLEQVAEVYEFLGQWLGVKGHNAVPAAVVLADLADQLKRDLTGA